ncbi:ABC transporter permease [Limnochorda pilosa]|nr:iron ABC transporter permease [Limnochorda pilosa]
MALPLAYLVLRSAMAGSGAWRVMTQPRLFELLANSLGLAAAVTAGAVLLAVPLSWLLLRADLPGARFWSSLLVLPLAVPSYIGGFVLISAVGPGGLLAQLLRPLGVESLPEPYGFAGAWIALTLFTYPYVLLSVRAAWSRLDPALEEASRSMGLGRWATFWGVTLPQLRPAIAVGSLLVGLYALSDFGAVSLLQFDTFTRAIYAQYAASFNRGRAALLALALVLVTVMVLELERRTRARGTYFRRQPGAARPAPRVALGPWKVPALVGVGLLVLAGVGTPVGVLLYWTVRGILQGQEVTAFWAVARNSLLASGLAAAATGLMALPVAVLGVRYPGRLSRVLDRLVCVSYGLPGIVLALALVFFSARSLPALYQTLPVLTLAYAVHFMPQAVGAFRTSFLQVNPSLEEAARGLGRSPLAVLRTVSLPLVRPGLLSGAVLVFLTAMKELPATLLLAPTGFRTLATVAWLDASEGFFARAAVPGLVLLLLSGLSVWVMLRQDRAFGREPQ